MRKQRYFSLRQVVVIDCNEKNALEKLLYNNTTQTSYFIDDPKFLQQATSDEFNVRLVCQPPNNPEINILNMSYFRATQSIQYSANPSNDDDIIEFVGVQHCTDIFWIFSQSLILSLLQNILIKHSVKKEQVITTSHFFIFKI